MVDLKAWGANLIAPGSGFLVKAFDKAKEWKDKAVEAAKIAKEKISKGKTYATGVAASTVVQAGYEAPKGKVWAQPGVVFVIAFFLFLYLRFIGVRTLANWILISASASLVVGVIFKEPKKGFVVLLLPVLIWFLQTVNMLTSTNIILSVGIVAILVVWTFERTREFANKVLTVLIFLFGGIILFWLSVWAQSMLKFQFPNFVTTFLILAYLFVIAVWPSPKDQKGPNVLKWIALFANLLFFVTILLAPTTVSLISPPGTPLYVSVYAVRQGWFDSFNTLLKTGKEVYKGFETQVFIASGDYEMGVEAQSQKPLGVFLDNVGVTSPIVTETDKYIDVFGRLRVESFKTGENLTVNVRCFVDGMERKTKGNITPHASFSVEEYEMQEIDCLMPVSGPGGPGVGTPTIVLEASFDFTTSAFLKSYFMDQETVRSMRRQQIDPLDAFKIADKSPIAKFTGGPLMIGMGAGQQPVALVAGDQFGPTLTITFDRNWLEGELYNITNMSITVPPGLKIENVDGNIPDPSLCSGGKNVEQACVLEGGILDDLFDSPVSTPKTIRVHTALVDNAVLLANAPLAIRSFKVNVKYNYIIKKKASVIVRAKEVPK